MIGRSNLRNFRHTISPSYKSNANAMNEGVLHLVHSRRFYGAEAVILNLCLGLRELGYRSVIGCFCDHDSRLPDLAIKARERGIHVECISFRRKIDHKPLARIKRIMGHNGLTLLHSHGYKPSVYCMLAKLIYGFPFVVTCHLWTRETRRLELYAFFERLCMLSAKKVIGVSAPIVMDINKWNCLKAKTLIINNGIDVTKYTTPPTRAAEARLREELGIRNDAKVVGTVGRLTLQKNHEAFLDAASIVQKHLKNTEFVIVGDGYRMDYLKSYAKSLGLERRVHFLGFRNDAIQVLSLFDAFVLSSRDEGLPIVILEAMSVGVPVIATKVGEITNVIEHLKEGLLVEKPDATILASSILRVLTDHRLASRLVTSALKKVRNEYSIGRMCEKYVDVYRNLH